MVFFAVSVVALHSVLERPSVSNYGSSFTNLVNWAIEL